MSSDGIRLGTLGLVLIMDSPAPCQTYFLPRKNEKKKKKITLPVLTAAVDCLFSSLLLLLFFLNIFWGIPRSSLVFPLTACGSFSTSMNRRPWWGGRRFFFFFFFFDRAGASSNMWSWFQSAAACSLSARKPWSHKRHDAKIFILNTQVH